MAKKRKGSGRSAARTKPINVLRVRHKTTLARLLDQRIITGPQYEAGERLYADWYEGGLTPRVKALTEKLNGGGGAGGMSDTQALALANYKRALAFVGPQLDQVARLICCEDWSVRALEERNKWPRKSGTILVRIALTRLAMFYGYVTLPQYDARAVLRRRDVRQEA